MDERPLSEDLRSVRDLNRWKRRGRAFLAVVGGNEEANAASEELRQVTE